MDSLISWITAHASIAHFAFFGLLMLAGFCVPISEDLVIISAAFIASTIIPENTWPLFIGVFLGSYLSDWEAYAIGRFGGPRLLKNKWFSRHISPVRVDKLSHFYNKYGFWTLLLGRFIPFGVRNALFITAGLGKMPFWRFIIADGIACIISNAALFSLAYWLGNNYTALFGALKIFNIVLFASAALLATIALFWYKKKFRKTKSGMRDL